MNPGPVAWGCGIGVIMGSVLLFGCSWFGGKAKPDWIDGISTGYPPARYLTGVGQGDNLAMAEDQAYASLARIFKAEVSAQSKDWETYLLIEERGRHRDERRLTLDNVTRVSTDKVLENVKIVDRWYDPRKGLHYALSGMDRSQAEASLMERLLELDHAIQSDVEDARGNADKLLTIRGLRRAIRNLVLREAFNADLRVIRTSGHGTVAPYRVSELTRELEDFISSNLVLEVVVTGDQTEPVRRALIEGLIREGLPVRGEPLEMDAHPELSKTSPVPELLVRGTVRVWPIDVRDPNFKYVRWCSEFEVVDATSQRVVGAISEGGKEGHLTVQEATAKVLRVMQRDMSEDVARRIAAHVYGEAELPAEAVRPAGCPREGLGQKPATAIHQ